MIDEATSCIGTRLILFHSPNEVSCKLATADSCKTLMSLLQLLTAEKEEAEERYENADGNENLAESSTDLSDMSLQIFLW